jgi:PBSX family phage terminase large subunit
VIRFDYDPLPIHRNFHESTAFERALFGAFGSGKTYGLCAEAIAVCLEQPGTRALITRKTVPELRDTTETVFFDILPNELYAAGTATRIGGHYEKFIFPNGSHVLFRSIDDWTKHKSLNVAWIFWDEADEFDEDTYRGMSSRVRQRDPTAEAKRLGAAERSITRRGMCLATNPAGHNWIYKRFIEPTTAEPNTAFFKSTSFDNPYLPPEYLQMLMQAPEDWVRRYVLCQFDDFAGQIYTDWGHDTHIVPMPKELPAGEVFWMGMDPGTRSPTAGLWVWLDKENRRLVGVDEYMNSGIAAAEHANYWRALEAKHKMRPRWRVADPTIMTRDRGTAMTLHSQYQRLGFNFDLGPRTHKVRIPMLGQLIHLKKFVLAEGRCPMAFEQISNYKWEDISSAMRARGLDAPEKPMKRDDHLVDCAQYLSSRWIKPIGDELNLKPQDFSQQVHAAINKQLQRKRRPRGSHDLGSVVV